MLDMLKRKIVRWNEFFELDFKGETIETEIKNWSRFGLLSAFCCHLKRYE